MTVLFISSRPIPRCENITAVYEAYNGPKVFDQMYNRTSDILSGKVKLDYDLVVTDELVKEAKSPVLIIFHGAVGGKTFLLQRPGNRKDQPILNGSKLITYAVSSSDTEEAIETIALQCGIKKEQVLPLGLPRLDWYMDPEKKTEVADFRKYKYVYLYVPTFRRLDDKGIPPIDLRKIDDLLADNELFVVKPHMVAQDVKLEGFKHIIAESKDMPTRPYMTNCDVVISDYSSTIFDAHAIGKPVVLFEKDHDSYLKDPGVCMNYPEDYASRHTQNEEELVELMRLAVIIGPKEADLRCKERTTNMCDGHATERVVQLINDMLEGKR